MQAISIIKSEHLNLGAVLYSLEKLIEEIDRGKHPDYAIFHGLLTYIDRFLDRHHHPKENDYLFPRLLERAPDCADLIAELGRQHGEGEKLLVVVFKALSAWEFSGESEYPALRDAVLRYTEFERGHAQLEEREILPRARESLQAGDWQAIDAAFGENRDPMFRADRDNEFSALFGSLINRLPAPIGLGKVWK